MNADAVHGYLNAGRALSPWANTAVEVALTVLPGVIFVGLLLGLWCGISAACHAVGRLRDRRADPSQTDLDVCNAIWKTRTRSPWREKP